jgi:hypothetical protein
MRSELIWERRPTKFASNGIKHERRKKTRERALIVVERIFDLPSSHRAGDSDALEVVAHPRRGSKPARKR